MYPPSPQPKPADPKPPESKKQEEEEEEEEGEVPVLDAAAMRRLEANMKPEAPPCHCFRDKGESRLRKISLSFAAYAFLCLLNLLLQGFLICYARKYRNI